MLMTKTKKTKRSIQIAPLETIQRILKVIVHVPVGKSINGSISQGNMSYMMELNPISYTYGTGESKKTATCRAFRIKGLRGGVRHSVMQMCLTASLEVCHSSNKLEDKHGNSFLPAGFHAQASCLENDQECIVHRMFGSLRQKSRIAVDSPPVVNPKHDTAQFAIPVQLLKIGTENCTVMSYDEKPIQNFKHHYFSGEFYFEIDVTKCEPQDLGLLIEAVTHLKKIGGGYNSGYGHIASLKFSLLQRSWTTKRTWDGDGFIVTHHKQENILQQEVENVLQAWQEYLASQGASIVNKNPTKKSLASIEV